MLLKNSISNVTLVCSPWCPEVLEMAHSAFGIFIVGGKTPNLISNPQYLNWKVIVEGKLPI